MLRSLYRCLLGLHPPGFRKRFAEEMLSIFDQSTGRAAAFRLLMDGFVSLGRQWALRPEFWHDPPTEQPASDGVPSFHTLDPFRPRTAAVIHGMVLSVAIFCATCYAIRYSWIRVLHIHIPEVAFESSWSTQPSASAPAMPEEPGSPSGGKSRLQNDAPAPFRFPSSSVNKAPSPPPVSAVQNQAAIAQPVRPGQAGSAPTQAVPAAAIAAQKGVVQFFAAANSRPGEGSETSAEPQSQAAPGVAPAAVVKSFRVEAAERHRVIDGAVAALTKYYVDPDVAQRMADALRTHEKNGDDDSATDGHAFADLLTRQMWHVSHDKYVLMVYSTISSSENPPPPTPADVARYRREMQQNNCTFEKVETLPHNIGYLKFNTFPDAAICGPTAAAAMAKLNDADAIIFDLRDNPGGYANMVARIATYLFDRPTHLNDFYNRADNSTEQSWTLPPVPGNKLAGKPAFVLTSHTTFSAAEGFSYDLKMLRRATLVGETTSGRGHMGMAHRIDDHFLIRVPGVRVINPISKTNWEGTGVQPDVAVKAADALTTAVKLAEREMQKK